MQRWRTSVLLLLAASCGPAPHDDNPRTPRTAAEKQQAKEQLEYNRYMARRKRFWLEQVESGEASFEEAGCGYRGGEWDLNTEKCDLSKPERLPTTEAG